MACRTQVEKQNNFFSFPWQNLPAKFCWRHLDSHKNKRLVNLQNLNGKVWPARHLVQRLDGSTRFRLSGGWTAFAKDNNLKVDDVCVFELTHKTNLTFLVHIFRETDSPSFQHIKVELMFTFLFKTISDMFDKFINLSSAESGKIRATCNDREKK